MENEKNMAMPEFTNEEVEKAIKQFLDEKSNENMANLMQAMRAGDRKSKTWGED